MKFACVLIVITLLSTPLAYSNSTLIPTLSQRNCGDEQNEEFMQKLNDIDILFLGDSITYYWSHYKTNKSGVEQWNEMNSILSEYNLFNCGIGGDRIEYVLFRLTNDELATIRPKIIVLMIGTNNIEQRRNTGLEIAEGIRQLIDTIQINFTETKILLMGITPSGRGADSWKRSAGFDANEIISEFADGNRVMFLDIGKNFLDPSSGRLLLEYSNDALHLTNNAYKIWEDQMIPILQEMLVEFKN